MDKSKYHPPEIIKDGGVTVKIFREIRTPEEEKAHIKKIEDGVSRILSNFYKANVTCTYVP